MGKGSANFLSGACDGGGLSLTNSEDSESGAKTLIDPKAQRPQNPKSTETLKDPGNSHKDSQEEAPSFYQPTHFHEIHPLKSCKFSVLDTKEHDRGSTTLKSTYSSISLYPPFKHLKP